MRWSSVSKLKELADDVMDVVTEAFAAEAIVLPDRRFISNGAVAYDCEQLSVEMAALGVGTLVADRQGMPHPGESPTVQIQIALIRDCMAIPDEDGNPPSVEAIEANADELLADGTVLIRAFLRTTSLSSCQKIKVLTCLPYGPEGTLGGWVLSLRAAL
jgi:hypothetical protein